MTLINEGDVAALNSGTTNTVLLQELVGLNLRVTVGTNNYAVLSALMQNPAIRLIAVGGSIMDVGKSLYRLYGKALPDADALRRLIEGKGYGRPSARWSGVPATAGTGSEVTCWTSIWDPEKNARRLAVPAPVWVLLMLVCLGMGPKAGVAGLCVHTTGFFHQILCPELREHTGRNHWGLWRLPALIFVNAVLPAALSQIVAWAGMCLETNFSERAILGTVGTGGVDCVISNSLQGYDSGTAGAVILLVFLVDHGIERIVVPVKKKFH